MACLVDSLEVGRLLAALERQHRLLQEQLGGDGGKVVDLRVAPVPALL
jgi:hypothetical protein